MAKIPAYSNRKSRISNSMNTFLLAIAAVSLIVGSIGIANTMFTSVLEKTKEIGIIPGTILSGFMPALMGVFQW